MCRIYEDNVLGKLPDARYAALDAQYAKEQGELASEIAAPAQTEEIILDELVFG